MERITLNRQEKGKLAELVARGLHRGPHELVEELVEEHVQERYRDLMSDRPVRITNADINSYRWFDVVPVSVPGDVGWRPDFSLKAEWKQQFGKHDLFEEWIRERNAPPVKLRTKRPRWRNGRFERTLVATFSVYYPVEVKSGDKKTLTDQQASAIPDVVNHVDHVHPLIATVETDELPHSYSMDIEEFSTSEWNRGGSSRYRS